MVMKYPKLTEFVEKKQITAREKIKNNKEFKNLSSSEKDALLEKILRDFGYIE